MASRGRRRRDPLFFCLLNVLSRLVGKSVFSKIIELVEVVKENVGVISLFIIASYLELCTRFVRILRNFCTICLEKGGRRKKVALGWVGGH